jgi:hypothetical protein
MAKKVASEEYLAKAKSLSKIDAERLFSRMGRKIGRRLDENNLAALEALALQLEKEDEDLKEWRKQFAEIRKQYLNQIKSSQI